MSILGLGEGGLVKKSVNIANIYLLESTDEAAVHKKRCKVRGGTTDQGTEAGMGNNTVRILTSMSTKYDDGSDMDFMYPRMLPIAGHLHMIYNALEESFA